MGNDFKTHRRASVAQELVDVRQRACDNIGDLAVGGRYHQLPRRLEDDYDSEDRELGQGANGRVYLVTHKLTGHTYAMKPFQTRGINKAQRRVLRNEVEVFLRMDHPHVARLADVYEEFGELHLVMELLEGGELFHRIQEASFGRFTEETCRSTVWQMLLAVNYLHSMDIVHRDIKCENFLYEEKGKDHLKLIDFGFSRNHKPSDKQMALSCGTIVYMAPEVFDRSYDEKCDIWSLGVTTFILLMGYMPFSGSNDKEVIQQIREGQYNLKQELWSTLSPGAQDFLQKVLEIDVTKRLSAAMALEHPWIAEKRVEEDARAANLSCDILEGLRHFAEASFFRRACMEMVAWSLSAAERAKVREAFKAIDTEHNGTITLYEMKEAFQTVIQIDDQEIQRIFSALDSNHSETVNYTEFLAAMVSTRITLHDDLIKAAFDRFDSDKTGFITGNNLRKVLQDSYTSEQIDAMFKEVDFDGNSEISFDEFFQYLCSADCTEKEQEIAEVIVDRALREEAADVATREDGSQKASIRQKSRPRSRISSCHGQPEGDPPVSAGEPLGAANVSSAETSAEPRPFPEETMTPVHPREEPDPQNTSSSRAQGGDTSSPEPAKVQVTMTKTENQKTTSRTCILL